MLSHRCLLLDPRGLPCRVLTLGWLLAVLTHWQSSSACAQGAVGGVFIDPEGMLRESSSLSPADLRKQLQGDGDAIDPSQRIAAASPLRKVSLRRLETAVAELHDAGQPIPPDIRYLAGLTAVKNVFVLPEMGDVVLAGPAEGWDLLPTGDAVGNRSKRPVLQLDDLVVALRYAFADNPAGSFLGCSIEPTEKGLKAHAAYVRKLGGMDRTQLPQIIRGMEQAMGPQNLLVYGVDGSSRFALQMIAADYRLKRIALAHDPSPSKKVPSYLDLAEKSVTGGPQRQHRWWFVGHYDAIRHTPDRLAFEFVGAGLKVDTAPAQLTKEAARNSPKPARAATMFAELATQNFPELAEKIPAFAELQNLVSLAVAGVLIRRQVDGVPNGKATADADDDEAHADVELERPWRPVHFLSARRCPIASYDSPKHAPSLANARFVKDQFWMFSVSGGVEINPAELASGDHLKPARDTKLGESHKNSKPSADHVNWWWD